MKDLIYPSAYHAMKAGPCRVGVCKHDGRCGKCKEYGELRRYAARDTDRIALLRALVKEMADAMEAINTKIEFDPYIGGRWTIGDEEFESLHTGALFDKARKVIGGAE